MLRLGLGISLVGWLMLTASADTPRKWTDAANMGLHGPVHTQLFTSKKLGEDPRDHPKLHIWSPLAWMVFDPRGSFLEQSSSLREDGNPEAVIYMKYDSDGRILESNSEIKNHAAAWRNEYRSGPYGTVERKTFRGERLAHLQSTDYDDRGNVIEERAYDASGELTSRSSYRYDEHNRVIEWQVFGPQDQFVTHVTDRYDKAGQIAERVWLNAQGQTTRIMEIENERLVWWWQDPNCDCSGGIGLNDPEKGMTTSYEIQSDGTVETIVENHAGRHGNVEVDEMERFGSNGDLLEKLTFRYQRDHHGNWVARTISAWDPNTNSMILIQEDHRAITYY